MKKSINNRPNKTANDIERSSNMNTNKDIYTYTSEDRYRIKNHTEKFNNNLVLNTSSNAPVLREWCTLMKNAVVERWPAMVTVVSETSLPYIKSISYLPEVEDYVYATKNDAMLANKLNVIDALKDAMELSMMEDTTYHVYIDSEGEAVAAYFEAPDDAWEIVEFNPRSVVEVLMNQGDDIDFDAYHTEKYDNSELMDAVNWLWLFETLLDD